MYLVTTEVWHYFIVQEAETTDGRPSKKMDVSTTVAPHVKKEDFSVSASDHKMQQAKELKLLQAKVGTL